VPRFPTNGPIDLRRTMTMMSLWGATTWLKVDETGVWYAERTPDGPGTLHVVKRGDHLEAEAFGDGGERLIPRVPELFGLERSGIEALEPQDSVVREIKKRMRGLRIGRSGRVYSRAVSAGLAQLVTGRNAKPAMKRVARQMGERAPGPRDDLFLLPPHRQLARTPYYAFHPLNIERHRADLIKRIADRAPALQRAAKMPPVEGRAHLEKLRGIGPWTSGVIMACPLGDPDAVPIGDWHLPNLVAFNLAGEPRADDARMMQLLEPYEGMRGLVARMLKSGGSGAPKYGPKNAAREIRHL
jgi:3-methyladenine DNA glycosylase/8-oxoguanine DNA glycosylase